ISEVFSAFLAWWQAGAAAITLEMTGPCCSVGPPAGFCWLWPLPLSASSKAGPMVRRKTRMRILLCHNYYQQRGGEDESFEAEASLLEARGHDVVRYTVHNDSVEHMS